MKIETKDTCDVCICRTCLKHRKMIDGDYCRCNDSREVIDLCEDDIFIARCSGYEAIKDDKISVPQAHGFNRGLGTVYE